ncbi:MAG: hypothetical protein K9N51_14045 [Candidatus Pacebacteria bacterium]|nr:hypothetical protein [Candidatus Paceibacterota bacterium]
MNRTTPGLSNWKKCAKVFERFGQLLPKKYSAGLGLTFCKLAVEAHQGMIGLRSRIGEGSTFWFKLPAANAAHARV